MKTGIIGLPQVGKTSLFRILTGAKVEGRSAPNQAHIGIAKVPDPRVLALAEIFKPKKNTFATIEYVDVGGLHKNREKNSASLVPLREADALAHVVRLFENPAVPHEGGSLDAMRDIESVEIELLLYDLEQASKRIERLEKERNRPRNRIGPDDPLSQSPRSRAAPARTRIQARRNEDAHRFRISDPQAHALRPESRRRRSRRHRSRHRKTSPRKTQQQTRNGGRPLLRKNRSRARRAPRIRSERNDGRLRPERIRPRPPDPGHLQTARTDFVPHR